MKNHLLGFLLAASAASPAAAYVDAGLDQTFGSSKYYGTSLYGIYGVERGLYVRPSLSVYHSDASSGTYKTLKARVGYDQDLYSVGGEIGGSPKVNGYSNNTLGGDVTFTFVAGGGPKKRLAGPDSGSGRGHGGALTRIDAGGGLNFIFHHEDLPAAGPRPARRFNLRETDLSLFGGVEALGLHGSIELVKSSYDKDIDSGSRGARLLLLPGIGSIVQGLPDSSVNLKVSAKLLTIVEPYVSFTRTKYKISQPDSKAVELGASADLGLVSVRGHYERYDPGAGQAKQNYVGIGGSVGF